MRLCTLIVLLLVIAVLFFLSVGCCDVIENIMLFQV
jgi:hypothetical protein